VLHPFSAANPTADIRNRRKHFKLARRQHRAHIVFSGVFRPWFGVESLGGLPLLALWFMQAVRRP
jgi:hypothetical protein